MDGLSRRSIPNDHRFALVGDADACEAAELQAAVCDGFPNSRKSITPNVFGIVLDPTRLGIVLLKLPLGDSDGPRRTVENDRTRGGCALIDREDVIRRHGRSIPSETIGGRAPSHKCLPAQ